MAHISRLYDFQPGTKILSSQVDAEVDQMIEKLNELDDANTTLANTNGAARIGTSEEKTVQAVLDETVRFTTSSIRYVRLNADKVIETSTDQINWQATGSSGHLVLKSDGTVMPQRGRLQFLNTTITDDVTNNLS